MNNYFSKSRKENPQKPTQLSSRSHPRHLVGKKDSTKDTIIDITSSQLFHILSGRADKNWKKSVSKCFGTNTWNLPI